MNDKYNCSCSCSKGCLLTALIVLGVALLGWVVWSWMI